MIKKEAQEKYFADPSISNSRLKIWRDCLQKTKTPLMYEQLTKNIDSSSAMLLGSAFDELMLQPKVFQDKVKYWRLSLTAKEMSKLKSMSNAWLSTDFTKILSSKIHEGIIKVQRSLYNTFKTEEGSVNLKSMVDMYYEEGQNICMDLKTTYSLTGDSFKKFNYSSQAGFYSLMFELEGKPLSSFSFIMQETQYPWDIAVIEYNKEELVVLMDRTKDDLLEFVRWFNRINKTKKTDCCNMAMMKQILTN